MPAGRPSELCLPPGWSIKEVRREFFYKSPSGFLCRTAKDILAHMGNEGSYTKDQVDQFRTRVEVWQAAWMEAKEESEGKLGEEYKEDAKGKNDKKAKVHKKTKVVKKAKIGRKGQDLRDGWEAQQPKIPTKSMKEKILEAFIGESSERNKKVNVATKSCDLENVVKSLKSNKTKSSKRKLEANVEDIVVGDTGDGLLGQKRKKLSPKMPNEEINKDQDYKQAHQVSQTVKNQSLLMKSCDIALDVSIKEKEKEFNCEMCNKRYFQKHNLNRHIKTNHGENSIPKINNDSHSQPQGLSTDSTLPQGCSKDSTLPHGWSKDSSLPQGCSKDSSLPQGWSKDSILPQGWSEDSILPQGWSVATVAGRQIYREPGGHKLEGRVQALAHMLELGSPPEEMFRLWSSLGEEGWVMEDSLPIGWSKRKTEEGEEEFLSPMMEVFPRTAAFLQFVLSGGV